MARYYRALISVPVFADTDDEAWKQAALQAERLLHPGGEVIAGHLELLGEVREGSIEEIIRVVDADPGLLAQLPPDWKP